MHEFTGTQVVTHKLKQHKFNMELQYIELTIMEAVTYRPRVDTGCSNLKIKNKHYDKREKTESHAFR